MVSELRDRFGFGQMRIMPCGRHALGKRFKVDDTDRLAMLKAAFRESDDICLDLYEMCSPDPSYAVDSCRRHQATAGGAPLFFVVGSDILGEFHRWERWREILQWSNLLIVRRPRQSAVSPMTAYAGEAATSELLPNLPDLLKSSAESVKLADCEPRVDGTHLLNALLSEEDADNQVREVLLAASRRAADQLTASDSCGSVVCAELSQWPLSSSIIRFAMERGLSEGDTPDGGEIQTWMQGALPEAVWSYIKERKLYREV